MKRVRSEKANLELHILGMESELESLQEERTRLKDETDAQRRTCSGLELHIETLMTEVGTVFPWLVLKQHNHLLISGVVNLNAVYFFRRPS